MKSRKLTVIIVSLCMCVSVLSGCGSTAEKEQAQHATEAQTAAAEPDTSLEDGEYTVNVELEGGSGRASVDSEAKVKVTDGQAYATIVWSSTYYDYMLVDGKKYTNENEGGNSTFTFPIAGVPCTMDVVGDTTAMSQPHEIDYTLTFSFAKDVSFKDLKQTGQVKLSYADQFQIDEYGNYKLITIVDNGRFLLIPKGVPVPADVPEDVTVLQQPLNHVYLVSSAVMDLICQAGGLSHVAYTALKEDDWYVQQAKEKGISVYACDTPIEDADVPYIGIDNEKLGYELGEQLARALDYKGKIGVIAGDFNQAGHRMRVNGFEKYMEKEPGITIEMVRNGYSNMQVSQKDVDEILKKYPDLDGIMTTSAVTALGLAEATEGREISIVSVDAQEDALKAVQDGRIVALGAQSGYQIGYETIRYIVNDLEGKRTGEDEILDSQVLTTENIDAYIKEDKYSSS